MEARIDLWRGRPDLRRVDLWGHVGSRLARFDGNPELTAPVLATADLTPHGDWRRLREAKFSAPGPDALVASESENDAATFSAPSTR